MSYISADKITSDNNVEQIVVWERDSSGRKTKYFPVPHFFYIEDEDGPFTSMTGEKLKRLDFANKDDFRTAYVYCKNERIKTYEATVNPVAKVLSQHYYNSSTPKVNITFYDIEVDYNKDIGFAGVETPYAPINSVSLYHAWKDELVVIAIPPDEQKIDEKKFIEELNTIDPIKGKFRLKLVKTERDLLIEFLNEIEDSDLYCGWNSDTFDTPYVGRRLESYGKRFLKKFDFPETTREPTFRDDFKPFRNSSVTATTMIRKN